MASHAVDMTIMASQYFATINPIAVKIRADIDAIADCYEHLWSSFTAAEQGDVINEMLIKPAAVLQYSHSTNVRPTPRQQSRDAATGNEDADDFVQCGYDGRRLATFAKQRTGLKRIQDDVCGVYRDEHSRPFAVKTKSQIALHLFASPDDVDDAADKVDGCCPTTPLHSMDVTGIVVDPMLGAISPRLSAVLLATTKETHSVPVSSHTVAARNHSSSSPSKPIVLPPAVSSAQLSPMHGSKPTTFLAKLINRSVTPASASGGGGHDDTRCLMVTADDDDHHQQQLHQLGAGSTSAMLSFSSTEDDDDDKHNFGERNALLESAVPSCGRRRSSQHTTDPDATKMTIDPSVVAATYDFLNNW